MNLKLLCTDIDGTLLDDKKNIPEPVKEALQNLSKKGVYIALASGRMPAGVDDIEKKLGIECIKICNAGTYTLMGDTCIHSEHLSISTVRNIYERISQKYNIPLWLFSDKDWFVTAIDKHIEQEMSIIPYQPKIVDVYQLTDQWEKEGKSPNKLLIAADVELVPAVYRDVKEQGWTDINIACSSATFMEISPYGADKGKALASICQKLNISLKDTVSFGDQEVDLPIIEASGIGIAMGNAIPKLKQKADFITKTNNEAGIAYALEHFL